MAREIEPFGRDFLGREARDRERSRAGVVEKARGELKTRARRATEDLGPCRDDICLIFASRLNEANVTGPSPVCVGDGASGGGV